MLEGRSDSVSPHLCIVWSLDCMSIKVRIKSKTKLIQQSIYLEKHLELSQIL